VRAKIVFLHSVRQIRQKGDADMNLMELFSEIRDFRRAEGRRYPLAPMLIIIVMSVICGRICYREIAGFAKAGKDEFQKYFGLKRNEMPSHVTFREIIQRTGFEEICQTFEKWAKNYVSIEKGDWLSADGKCIRSAVSDYSKSWQDSVSPVSIFAQKQGRIIRIAKLSSRKSSEIPAVEEPVQLPDLEGQFSAWMPCTARKNFENNC